MGRGPEPASWGGDRTEREPRPAGGTAQPANVTKGAQGRDKSERPGGHAPSRQLIERRARLDARCGRTRQGAAPGESSRKTRKSATNCAAPARSATRRLRMPRHASERVMNPYG